MEHDRRTAAIIRENVATLGFDQVDVVVSTVARTVERTPRAPYDVVFLDPPYAVSTEEVEAVLVGLRDHGWLAHRALVVVERAGRGPGLTWPEGFAADRRKTYGETVLCYGHATG